jgi:hypothetical protein
MMLAMPAANSTITCPVSGCGAPNSATAESCVACLTPLAGYGRLAMHGDALFNRGLRAARAGDGATARDLFAAVVHWQPHDVDARNAHALACLGAGDLHAARSGWEDVLARCPGDALAAQGLSCLKRPKAKPGAEAKPRPRSERSKPTTRKQSGS